VLSKQNYGTIRITDVAPNQTTRLQVTEGFWSLSTLSNVPYVELVGGGSFQKILSWNEIVEIPKGETAQVKNASWHKGDIVLNGGRDFGALPSRITVPVQWRNVTQGNIVSFANVPVNNDVVITEFQADVRRARRAFLVTNFRSGVQDASFIVRGFARQRSHDTVSTTIGGTASAKQVGYENVVDLNAVTDGLVLPLGYRAANGLSTDPHSLLDAAEVEFTFETGVSWNFGSYFMMEYS